MFDYEINFNMGFKKCEIILFLFNSVSQVDSICFECYFVPLSS